MLIIKRLLLLAFIFSACASLSGQIYYVPQNSDTEYEINSQSEDSILQAFLKSQRARAIEFNTSQVNSRFPFRIQLKNGHWMLFDVEENSGFMRSKCRNYSFQLPSSLMEEKGFSLAAKNEMTFLVNIQQAKIAGKMKFDTLIVLTTIDTVFVSDSDFYGNGEAEYQAERPITEEVIEKIVVKKEGKWGLIEVSNDDDFFYLSHNFQYDSPKEVPPARGFPVYQLEMIEDMRDHHNLDLLVALDQNGYIFKGRHKKSKLWGVYAGEGRLKEAIPPQYSEIQRHRYPETYEVWIGNKVGYYNGNYQLVFEPVFEDFAFVNLDYKNGCALKRNGRWELYDAHQAKKLIDSTAITIEDLLEIWYYR